jgi:hypothetical protein
VGAERLVFLERRRTELDGLFDESKRPPIGAEGPTPRRIELLSFDAATVTLTIASGER